MTPTVAKIICAGLALILAIFFGYLPSFFTSKLIAFDPEHPDYDKKNKKNVILSFLLNFGGGVLIANCFCHWLPEVREGIEKKNFELELPWAEIIMCGGFFMVSILEELVHHCIHPHKKKDKKKKDMVCETFVVKEDEFARYDQKGKGVEETSFQKEEEETDLESHSHRHNSEHEAEEEADDGERIKSLLRTFFVIVSLSLHSVIAGLALGLEEKELGVWMTFAAIVLHKFIIAFTIGVELVSTKATKLQYLVSILVFSMAPPVGAAIGIVLTVYRDEGAEIDDFPLQIVQGIATGTIMYVVFFEIISKAQTIGGTGLQHVVAMCIGFLSFMPSLYLHTLNEHLDVDDLNTSSVPPEMTTTTSLMLA